MDIPKYICIHIYIYIYIYQFRIFSSIGKSISIVSQMAIDDINDRSDILEKYKLIIDVTNTNVSKYIYIYIYIYIFMYIFNNCPLPKPAQPHNNSKTIDVV